MKLKTCIAWIIALLIAVTWMNVFPFWVMVVLWVVSGWLIIDNLKIKIYE